jgi:hypothetical protein
VISPSKASLCAALLPLFVNAAPAQQPAQAERLRAMVPDAAVLVVESADPATAARELQRAVGGLPAGLREHLGISAWAGLAVVWVAIGGDPAAFAAQMAGGGAVVALVPHGDRPLPVLLLRPRDPDAAQRWLQRVAPKLPRVLTGDVLVLCPDADVGRAVAARNAAHAGRWATIDLGPPAAIRGALDLVAIRSIGDKRTFADLPGAARFLLLPLAWAAAEAPLARFTLAGGERLVLTASAAATVRTTPFAALLPEPHDASEPADVPLAADGIGMLRLDRSLRALLATPERFLPPPDVLAVQGFLSIADAIDGASSSFVDDLLGGLREPLVLHVLPVTPPEEGPPPRLQLPGVAIVAAVADPGAETVLFRIAQALAVISNAERSQRGQAAFPLRARTTATGRGLVAEPLAWRGPGEPPIEQALSPTVWSENGHVVLATTHAAAMAVVAMTYTPSAATATATRRGTGDLLVLRGEALAAALTTSRSVLALGRVLDEGEEPAAATRFLDVLALLVGAVRELTLRVDCDDDGTTLELTLERGR